MYMDFFMRIWESLNISRALHIWALKPQYIIGYLTLKNRKEEKKKKHTTCNLLLSALISIFPSLINSLMNLLVRSSSISWHLSRSLKSGLSRKESLNSSAGSPIVKVRMNETVKQNLTNTSNRKALILRKSRFLPNVNFPRLRVPKHRIPKSHFRHFVSLLNHWEASVAVTPTGLIPLTYSKTWGHD